MVDEVKLKTNHPVIVGMIPQPLGEGYANNKAMSINWRLEKYLKNWGVGFVDPFDYFYKKVDLFQRDGTPLKGIGHFKQCN